MNKNKNTIDEILNIVFLVRSHIMDPPCLYIIVLIVAIINYCTFLFKIDSCAVIYCPESFLMELGLTTKSDL